MDSPGAALVQELGREPTADEITGALGMTSEEVEDTLAISRAHLSLDAPVAPGEDSCLMDCLPDVLSPGPEELAFENALVDALDCALDTLEQREAAVPRIYFGLGHEVPRSLEEIGRDLGVTRERVRQIKERALQRLRHASRARYLESFTG